MLGKLLKYEVKATARWCLPMYGLLLIMAAVNRIFLELRDQSYSFDNSAVIERFRNLPIVLGTSLYVFIIAAVFIVTTVIIIQRFYKNLMGDEGYLMVTLPVQPWENIVSKLLVGILWTVVSVIITGLSIVIIMLNADFISEFPYFWEDMRYLFQELGMSGVLFTWLLIAGTIVSTVKSILAIYASIAIGQLSNNHKVLCAFAAYIGINIVENTVSGILSAIMMFAPGFALSNALMYSTAASAVTETVNMAMAVSLIFQVVLTVVLFIATNYILSKKLNLE